MENFSNPAAGSRWPNGKQRMVPRYSVLAIAELAETSGTVCIVGRMTEVSSKGCYVNTPSTLPVDSILKVVISRDEETFLTNGRVIYVHEGIGMGIVFVDPAGDQQKILTSWLADAPELESL
jgi:PilZ domain